MLVFHGLPSWKWKIFRVKLVKPFLILFSHSPKTHIMSLGNHRHRPWESHIFLRKVVFQPHIWRCMCKLETSGVQMQSLSDSIIV
jgi:hypothetical protein